MWTSDNFVGVWMVGHGYEQGGWVTGARDREFYLRVGDIF